VGEAFDFCSAARTAIESDPDYLILADDARAHLLRPLVNLLDTMSLHTVVLAIGAAGPTVFDAGPAGADGFRRPTELLADALGQRWRPSSRKGFLRAPRIRATRLETDYASEVVFSYRQTSAQQKKCPHPEQYL